MTKNSTIIQAFNKYEDEGAYHWKSMEPKLRTTFNPYLHARYNTMLAQIPQPGPNATAVDFGCGDAYITSNLAKRGYHSIGIDGSNTAIDFGTSIASKLALKKPIDLRVGNVCHTQLPDNTSDLCVSLDVIEHLDAPEEMLKEILRVSKNGATVIIGTPVRITEKPWDKYHVHEFFQEELKQLLGKYFEVKSLETSHPVEFLALMGKQFSFFGKKKPLGWVLINLYYLLTGKNLFSARDPKFPTYQFAICSVSKA